MIPLNHSLQAATGYLELGMAAAAHKELDTLGPEHQTDLRVVEMRVFVHQALGNWDLMEIVATVMCQHRPDDPQWPLLLAYATRRAQNLVEAREVLWEAWPRFPEDAAIQYNLACYECQLGRLVEAREYLSEACRLEAGYWALALEDEDLALLHGELPSSPRLAAFQLTASVFRLPFRLHFLRCVRRRTCA